MCIRDSLEPGEFLLKVQLPEDAHQRKGCYQKLRVRESWDFPEAGVAASWLPGDVSTLNVASTALESIPRLHTEQVAKHLEDGDLDPVALAKMVQKSVKPVNNTALPPRYRRSMVKTLTKRALLKILE